MERFEKIFSQSKPIVGMIHIRALPGTPQYSDDVRRIIDKALHEAKVYTDSGIDALAIENMHDVPYLNNNPGPEVNTLMSIIGYEIKQRFEVPCGIQILAAANEAALAAAHSAGMDFIRAEGFVYGHLADEGYIDSCAGDLLRYRKRIGAEHVAIFTDIKKKHSAHALTADVSVAETAKSAEFFLSDGLIITGGSTGEEADLTDLKVVKSACKIPTLIGSGVTLYNLDRYLEFADAMIVGSWFKKDGYWANDLEESRIVQFMNKVNELR